MNTDDLTAAVERLRDSTRGIGGQLSDDIRRVLAALESAQQDARRYRWLRGQMVHEHYGPLLGWTIGTLLPGDDPDAAIDAAMGDGDASTREQTSGGVDGHAASVGQQAAASHPGRGRPEAAPTAGIKPGPLDPIADLCARLRRPIVPLAFGLEAADALERLARERDDIRKMLQNTNRDAARAKVTP